MTVPSLIPNRKQLFDAGLALMGVTKRAWCEEQDVSWQHLDVVLRGERTPSARLNAAIDAVIAKVAEVKLSLVGGPEP